MLCSDMHRSANKLSSKLSMLYNKLGNKLDVISNRLSIIIGLTVTACLIGDSRTAASGEGAHEGGEHCSIPHEHSSVGGGGDGDEDR